MQDNLDLDQLATEKKERQKGVQFYIQVWENLLYLFIAVVIVIAIIGYLVSNIWDNLWVKLILSICFLGVVLNRVLNSNFLADLFNHIQTTRHWDESAPPNLTLPYARLIWDWLRYHAIVWSFVTAILLTLTFTYWAGTWFLEIAVIFFPAIWGFGALFLQLLRLVFNRLVYKRIVHNKNPMQALSEWHLRYPKNLAFVMEHLNLAYLSLPLDEANQLAREYVYEAARQGNWGVMQTSLTYLLNGLFWEESYTESLPIYVASIKSNPLRADYAVELARFYLIQKIYLQRASQWLKFAQSVLVANTVPHLHLLFMDIYAEAQNGKLDEIGIQNIERNIPNLLQHDPIQSAYYYYVIGLTYKAGQMPEKARYYFQKAYNLDIPKYIGQAVWREMGRL